MWGETGGERVGEVCGCMGDGDGGKPAVGGGSSIGLGKAIALRTDLPQIAVPTTYAGSEATPILGQTENGLKTTQRSMAVLPETIVYDVDLTLTLPPAMHDRPRRR